MSLILLMTDRPRTTINAESITTIRTSPAPASWDASEASRPATFVVIVNAAGHDVQVQSGLTEDNADLFVEMLTIALASARFGVLTTRSISERMVVANAKKLADA